jgi:hypothetical protein
MTTTHIIILVLATNEKSTLGHLRNLTLYGNEKIKGIKEYYVEAAKLNSKKTKTINASK